MSETPKLAYIHIGKSAGTWLRSMIEPLYPSHEICAFRFQSQFDNADAEEYQNMRFFSAHIGFETATSLNARLVTALRNPFDRVISLYFYWREVEDGPKIVKRMEIDEFFDYHFDELCQDVDNAQTWQLAYGHTLRFRRQYSNISKDALLAMAIKNLNTIDVIGVYENLPKLKMNLEHHFGFTLTAPKEKINTTRHRLSLDDIPVRVRNKIYKRNDLDVALYDHVLRTYGI